MTARNMSSLLYCALLLLPFLIERRKPDYSGTVDDVAVRIEAGSVTGAIPALLRVVPAHDAVEVWAHRRVLVDSAAIVAIDCYFPSAATHDRAFSRFYRFDIGKLAGGEVVLVLLRDVRVFPDVFRCGAELHTRRIVEASPLVFSSLHQLIQHNAGDGAVCHAVSGIAGCNPDVLIAAGITADVCHIVDRLDDLAGPTVLDTLDHWKPLAGPLLEPREAIVGVVGLSRLVILTADDQNLVIQLAA